jgi:hypothetical protein
MADDQIFVTCHILQVRLRGTPLILCILFNRATALARRMPVNIKRIIDSTDRAGRHRMADAK